MSSSKKSSEWRGDDITRFPACYGGEEFVILYSHTSVEAAVILAERLRRRVEEHSLPHAAAQPLGKVMISLGIATFPQDGSTAEETLRTADATTYTSKVNGHNRVTSHSKNNKIS